MLFLGIHSKLDYLQNLNLNNIWLRSVYPSSHYDLDFDVTDYKAVSEEFGSIEELEKLIVNMHKKSNSCTN